MTRFMKATMAAVAVGVAAGSATAQPPAKILPKDLPPLKVIPQPPMLPPAPMPMPLPPTPQPSEWKLGVKISANAGGGLMIHDVFAGSPAELAGLKAGMVLLAIDGALYNDPAAARDKVMLKSGDSIDLIYQDGTGFFQVTAKLATTTVMMMKAPGAAPEKKVIPLLKDVKRLQVADPRKK